MAVRLRLQSKSIKPQIDESIERLKQRVQKTTADATKQLADTILSEGRADIANAGRFTGDWISGFTYEISEDGKTIVFHHSKRLWRIFQAGAKIQGKPLLWIPVQPGGPRARDFPGRLFQVQRKKKRGVPLLMSAEDKQVKYIGVKRVVLRRRFHLLKIIRDEVKNMRHLFRDGMNKA